MEPSMTHLVCVRSLVTVAFGAAVLAVLAGGARADAINFEALGSQQVPSLSAGGVTITGSNYVSVSPLSGLAIRGGLPGIGIGGPDQTIDPTESVTFHFNGAAATNIVLSWQFAGGFGNASLSSGESVITAVGPAGNLLGAAVLTPQLSPLVPFKISAAFDNQPISSFTLQPVGDSLVGADLSLSALTFTVPEPASVLGWAAGLFGSFGFAVIGRRTRAMAPPAPPIRH
jgi:hypothetical protein